MKTTSSYALRIDGMTCGGCVRSARRALEALPGATVREISLDAPAQVDILGAGTTPDDLRRAVEDAGFSASITPSL